MNFLVLKDFTTLGVLSAKSSPAGQVIFLRKKLMPQAGAGSGGRVENLKMISTLQYLPLFSVTVLL
jgi:hypothetical protein